MTTHDQAIERCPAAVPCWPARSAALGWSASRARRGRGPGTRRRRRPDRRREIGCRITRLETLLVKPRWLFLKVHTNAGIVGLGEPIVEGRAETVATASRRSSLTWSARTRARWSITGRRSTATPSTAAGRS